jgi:WD40 repeat protein
MDETARIWDCPGGKELKTIKGHSGSNRVIVSADGKRFASASNDGVVQIGDTDTGKEPRLLAAQPGQAWSLVFSPDGKRLALGGKGTFKIWAADSGQELMTYQGETQPAQTVRAMAFSSDGTQLLFGGGDRTVKVVDIAGQKVVRSLSGHYGQVWSLALSPDGTRIAAGSDDNVLIVWDAHSGKEVARHNLITLLGYSGPVFSVAFSPKGDKIAFGSTGGTAGPAVIILDVDSPRCRMLSLQGLPAESTINAFDVSCDGKLFLTGISDGTARLWDGQTSTELATLQGHSKPVLCVGFSPDGKWAVSGSDDTTLRIWDVGAGRELRKLEGHGGSVRCVEVSPDGKLLASGSDDTTLRIWNAQTGDLLKTLKGHSQSLTSVCFSPDGTRLASGGGNLQNLEEAGELKIWNVQTGAELIGLKGHAGGVLSLAFSPNGMRLASGSWDKTVKVWDVFFPHKGTEAASMKDGHSDAVWAVTFSPDGTRVVSGSGDESVRVWDAQSGREVLALKGHAHAIRMPGPPEAKEERSYCVNYVGFSRDGRRITSAGCDGTVMLWEAE